MKRQLDFDALAGFDAIAVHGGIGSAARATRRSKATLSRHLRSLEQDLGVRLVERDERHLRLTEEGLRLHERTHGLLLDLGDAAEAIAGGAERPRGRLRISAPVVLAHVGLLPVVMRFAASHPEVSIELVAEDRKVDPVEDGYDLVIRIDPRPDERLVGRRLAADRRILVGPPGWSRPADGSDVPAVGLVSRDPPDSWRVRASDGVTTTLLPRVTLKLSSLLMVRDAVAAGAGAAVLPELLVAPDVAGRRLSNWGVADEPFVEIWALHPSRRLANAKTRTFLTHLIEAFATE